MSKIRKAVTAALSAAVAAGLASLQAAGTVDRDSITQAVGAAVAAGLLAGIAVYAAPKNAEPTR